MQEDYQSEHEVLKQEIARVLGFSIQDLPINITPEQTSKVLGNSAGTLAVWRSTGRYALQYVKIGRYVKYPVAGLIRYLTKRTRTQTGGENHE